jgi:hypothetical protein
MQAASTLATPRTCKLADIKAIVRIEKLGTVDHTGQLVGALSVISVSAERRGWTCQKCDVLFLQWAAVLAHLRQVAKGSRARVFSEEQIVDVVRFTRDVLGIKISDQQARAAAVAMRQLDQNLVISSRRPSRQGASLATRIAVEYTKIKGGHHADTIIFDDLT